MKIPNWLFLDSVYLLIDGEKYNYETVNKETNVEDDGTVKEWVVFDIPLDILSNLAFSSSSKIQFRGSKGNIEFIIDEEYKNHLQEYLNFVDNNTL